MGGVLVVILVIKRGTQCLGEFFETVDDFFGFFVWLSAVPVNLVWLEPSCGIAP